MQSTFQIRQSTRRWLAFFILMLVLSGLTAIPIQQELGFIKRFFDFDSTVGIWLNLLYDGLGEIKQKYPWMYYGYDWLAFAHIVIAIVFLGPYQDPLKNKWVVEFGMIACILIIPFAMIAGYFRGIPVWWRLIDCSFGILGMIPLVISYRKIHLLEELDAEERILQYSI